MQITQSSHFSTCFLAAKYQRGTGDQILRNGNNKFESFLIFCSVPKRPELLASAAQSRLQIRAAERGVHRHQQEPCIAFTKALKAIKLQESERRSASPSAMCMVVIFAPMIGWPTLGQAKKLSSLTYGQRPGQREQRPALLQQQQAQQAESHHHP